jgi:hypothetical protein
MLLTKKKKFVGENFKNFSKYSNWGQSCQGSMVVSGCMQARAKPPPKKKKKKDWIDWPM